MHTGRRLVVLALLVVVALTATGVAWGALATNRLVAHATCHGASPAAPATPKPCGGPCGSVSPLACCNQPFSVTTPDVLDTPSAACALISSAPGLLPPVAHSAVFALAPARVTPPPARHTILRL